MGRSRRFKVWAPLCPSLTRTRPLGLEGGLGAGEGPHPSLHRHWRFRNFPVAALAIPQGDGAQSSAWEPDSPLSYSRRRSSRPSLSHTLGVGMRLGTVAAPSPRQGLNRWLVGLSAGATANSGFVVTAGRRSGIQLRSAMVTLAARVAGW